MLLFAINSSLTTVSYTHLDVYKRQEVVIDRWIIGENATESRMQKSLKTALQMGDGVVTVSYTHLDVYKRQIIMMPLNYFSHKNFRLSFLQLQE